MERNSPRIPFNGTLVLCLSLASVLCLCACGLESYENYIRAPAANAESAGIYSFRHDASNASADALYGYEILYRFYASESSMQADSLTIEGYVSSFPTMVFSKMEALGYKRVTPAAFNKDILIIANEYEALVADDVTVSLVFTATDGQVILSILDDSDASLNSQEPVFRGVISPTVTNQGKGFDELRTGDADIAGTPIEKCNMQAYVFAVGINDDFTKFYSIPSKLGSNVTISMEK